MKPAKVEVWVWLLVYGGLLTVVLGLAAWRQDADLGLHVTMAGAALVAAGLFLIWLRSRMGP